MWTTDAGEPLIVEERNMNTQNTLYRVMTLTLLITMTLLLKMSADTIRIAAERDALDMANVPDHGPKTEEDPSFFVYLPLVLRSYTPGSQPSLPANNPPNVPSNPSPADGATNQSVHVNLSWTGGDPDGDTVTYDVYFEAGNSTPDVLICDDATSASCDPGPLSYATQYYWQVVAKDEHGATKTGPVWHFTTREAPGWQEVGTGSATGGGISDNDSQSSFASVAIAPDGTPYVAWSDDSSGDYEIYVRRWNGSTWEEVGTGSASGGGISDNTGDSYNPSMAIAPDGTPYVAWHNNCDGDDEIYVLRWVE